MGQECEMKAGLGMQLVREHPKTRTIYCALCDAYQLRKPHEHNRIQEVSSSNVATRAASKFPITDDTMSEGETIVSRRPCTITKEP